MVAVVGVEALPPAWAFPMERAGTWFTFPVEVVVVVWTGFSPRTGLPVLLLAATVAVMVDTETARTPAQEAREAFTAASGPVAEATEAPGERRGSLVETQAGLLRWFPVLSAAQAVQPSLVTATSHGFITETD